MTQLASQPATGPSTGAAALLTIADIRAAAARISGAVVHTPTLLLILDEPTIELDDVNSRLFIEMVNAIAAEKKIAILYVSHRNEPDLNPTKIFELIPTPFGSEGKVRE